MRKTKLPSLIILNALLLANVQAVAKSNILDYSSQRYVSNQFDILKLSLKELKVSSINQGQSVLITIPGHYGFQTASDKLKLEMKEVLKKLSKILNTYPETTIEIVGHTDNVGNRAYNQKLGMSRAKSVENEFIVNEVSPYRIASSSRGFDAPVCDNRTTKGKECNRRVEIILNLEKKLEF